MNNCDEDFDHEAEAAKMFGLIGNPFAEIRAIPRHDDKTTDLAVGLFRNARDFGDTAVGLSSLLGTKIIYAGVYVTVNEITDDLASNATGTMGRGWGIRAYLIKRIRSIFLDLDVTRNHPLGGKICATDEERAAALDLAPEIAAYTRSIGWPEPLVMNSGSGAYLIFRVDLPNNRESVALIKSVLETFAAKFDKPEVVHIDTGVFDPSRVMRIAGTWNRKSEHTEERPNRPVRILSAPERLEAVTLDQLNAFARTNIVPKEANETNEDIYYSSDERDTDCKARVEAVLKYLERVGFKPRSPDPTDDRFIRIPLPYCPFKGPEHTDGNTAILVWRNGPIGAKCFHKKCAGKNWLDFQIALSKDFPRPFEEK